MEQKKEILINVNVLCDDPYIAAKASEVLARAATSLALEGISVNMNMTEIETEQEGVEEK